MLQPLTYEARQERRSRHLLSSNPLITLIPKIELHIHIEGTLSPPLRWKLSQKHSLPLLIGPPESPTPLTSLSEVEAAYRNIRGRIGGAGAGAGGGGVGGGVGENWTFMEAYYGGFEILRDEDDFYELAMGYFENVSRCNMRYCEVFFDAQGHTSRGVPMSVIMKGFKSAQKEAERRFNIKSQWILCILRDLPPESAMQQYELALPYKDLIVGIGLDSDEFERPPSLFYDLFQRARKDGFKITSHCDFNQKNTHEHILQVATKLGGTGADRIDHGMNVCDKPELIEVVRDRGVGLTVCPCAYVRHTPEEEVFPRIRKMFDEGIKITIGSDDPAYMEDNWILENLYLVREMCGFTDREFVQLQRNAVEVCWAGEDMKRELLDELGRFESLHIKNR